MNVGVLSDPFGVRRTVFHFRTCRGPGTIHPGQPQEKSLSRREPGGWLSGLESGSEIVSSSRRPALMHSRGAAYRRTKRPYMVAMLLGTALSTLSPVAALAQAPEGARKAIDDMGRYCTTCWRNARLPVDSWGDCTQEVFSRLL